MITGATSLTSKQTEQLKKAFTDLSWHEISQQLLSKFLLIIVTFVLFLILLWVGRVIIVHLFQESKKYNVLKNSNRMATVKALVLNIYRYTCYFFLLYAILSEIGVPVGTLIAGAGIFSLALGLGAQSLVSDIVTGFFILLEQQLDVGDTVQIGQIKGTVTALGIRTTQVTSSDGTLNFIPNRNITIVQNLSRNNMVSNVDIRITSKTPLSKVEEIVTQVNKKLVPQIKALQLKPVIVGPVVTPDGALVFRVTITAVSGKQSTVASHFLAAYLKKLRTNNIPIAWEGAPNEY
ncbi:mechanosensitive ion channel family protein [Limosilactobacillus reuteri]|uniref:mechanosensitive ion channel family protein n=1 Tax=Limosilactobacillus reuteri TaxID=1598 RepID=UPI001E45C2B5|nr:mechanosensitive ion channel family protein [Limosilactobacillus reuteri]MCC4466070.1 mechanosensitive ion channel family protein [Limosilactobacillus reuteri]MCC4472312.1 mechanosensitive ion channel family protein [Limosilactobacillus reuteri]